MKAPHSFKHACANKSEAAYCAERGISSHRPIPNSFSDILRNSQEVAECVEQDRGTRATSHPTQVQHNIHGGAVAIHYLREKSASISNHLY
jgi:hypothetical protein